MEILTILFILLLAIVLWKFVVSPILIFIIVGVVLYFLLFSKKREHYGGPVKKIRKLPMGYCKEVCDTYYTRCMMDYNSTDPGWCYEKYITACPKECEYAVYQRL
jgi:hypothetical protein